MSTEANEAILVATPRLKERLAQLECSLNLAKSTGLERVSLHVDDVQSLLRFTHALVQCIEVEAKSQVQS